MIPAYLAYTGSETFKNTTRELGNLMKFFTTLSAGLGTALFAWSIYQLVLAFKDEATEPKVRAITLMVVGIMLMSAKTIVNQLLVGTGVTLS